MCRFEQIIRNRKGTTQYAVVVDGAERWVRLMRWNADGADAIRLLQLDYEDPEQRDATVARAVAVAKRLSQDPSLNAAAVLSEAPVTDPVRLKAETQQDRAVRGLHR